MTFLAEVTAAGVGPCGDYFLGYTNWILEPQGNAADLEVDTENLFIIEDHLRIAGPWIRTQFGVVRDAPEHYREGLTYSQERWELWKRSLRKLVERGNDDTRAHITKILIVMN
jgi:hypothetical protein